MVVDTSLLHYRSISPGMSVLCQLPRIFSINLGVESFNFRVISGFHVDQHEKLRRVNVHLPSIAILPGNDNATTMLSTNDNARR